MGTPLESLPGLSRPLRDAVASAGYTDLESLDGADFTDLLALHGVGRAGLLRVHAALQERGMGLTGAIPQAKEPVYTRGATGQSSPDIKTAPTGENPADWIESLPWPARIKQGRTLLEIFTSVTGEEPVMWGPSMVGYGQVHYRYATGREGDTFHLGFSPRKASISLYGLQSSPRSDELLARLGKHKRAVSCVYVNRLEDIDLDILAKLIKHCWESDPTAC